jgi:hypothetical protein
LRSFSFFLPLLHNQAAAGSGAASLHLADPFGAGGAGAVALSAALRGGDVTSLACAAFAGRGEMLVAGLRTPEGRGRLALLSIARTAGGATLALEHVTELSEAPSALAGYQGLLLCALGRTVRLYDAGKKHFLKKCENKDFPRQVVSFSVLGTRFLAADSEQSVLWCFFEAAHNAIRVFADETAPRYCTCLAPLDYNTGGCFVTLILVLLQSL